MKLLRRIITVNLSVGAVGFLLTMGQYHWDRSEILTHLARSLTVPFFVGTPVVLVLMRYGPNMYRRRVPINWLLISASILACAASGMLLFSLCSLALGLLAPGAFWTLFWTRTQLAFVLAMIFGIGAFSYHLLRADLEATTLELRSKQLENERERKLAIEAQLASLESHVRPHFLFNSLNTISSLIPEDPQQAESLVGKLATLLRSSLDSSQERVSALDRELKIVNNYLEIERARFGDRLRCRIEVPPELRSVEVPALALQTLVENSVKHAVAERLKGAEIRISAYARGDTIFLEVSDDGPGFTEDSILPGHGLDNVRRRLAALFGPASTLRISRSGDFTSVCVNLPSKKRELQ